MIDQPQLSSLASLGIVLLAAWGLYPSKCQHTETEPSRVSANAKVTLPQSQAFSVDSGLPAAKPAEKAGHPQPRETLEPRTHDPTLPSNSASPFGQPTTDRPSQKTPDGEHKNSTQSSINTSDTMVQKPARTPFAMSEKGESLADVASRVYGDRNLANHLMRANRDQVTDPDIIFSKRTILRTPDLENYKPNSIQRLN